MYGIAKPSGDDDKALDEGDEELDIEASIQKELAAMNAPRQKSGKKSVFTPINVSIECVFFMKTTRPVEPDVLVRRICEDAKNCPDPRQRKCRYINRLTPVFDTAKTTERGIERVARNVLAPYFELVPASDGDTGEAASAGTVATQVNNIAGQPFTVRTLCLFVD